MVKKADELTELRMLLRTRMEELNDSYVGAANTMGVSDSVLHLFLGGRELSIGTCLRLAKYIGMPLMDVLIMAGYEDIAQLIEEDPEPKTQWRTTAVSTALANKIEDLEDEDLEIVLDSVTSLVAALRKRRKARKKEG